MESRRITRSIRIAITAMSLTACVLLIALWVRSYSLFEWYRLNVVGEWSLQFQSAHGKAFMFAIPDEGLPKVGSSSVPHENLFWTPTEYEAVIFVFRSSPGHYHSTRPRRILAMPFWAGVFFTSALSAGLWLPWPQRFSLRTMLIATTLVAVGLAVIVLLR